ncbi:MAG: cysteine desulfurase [Desulfobacterota bacterium]|nr:cysteine desulfurase [Thermodesulfobacteriota bacterium]MDW8001438.1 cysteine desulfurase family protein [Deltaproteobacteria bacterium]
MERVFFENNSTTKIDERVLKAMLPYFTTHFGNPSSVFTKEGDEARRAIEDARKKVADFLNADPSEIVFTSCATESNNIAIKGLSLARKKISNRILFSEIEHYSILNQADFLRDLGFEVEYVKVDRYGIIDMDDLKKKTDKGAILLALIHASPEIGTIEPLKEVAAFLKERDILLYSDCVASAGRVLIDVKDLGIDALTISSHLIHGPKGVSALYLKKGIDIVPIMQGGYQEMGIRPGTENVPAIVGFGEACVLAKEELDVRRRKLYDLGKLLWDGIASRIEHVHFTGHPVERLPGHVSFWVEFVEGEALLMWLNLKSVASSSGSACASNIFAKSEVGLKASHVLTAIGIPPDVCHGSITFMLSKDNTLEEVEYVLSVLPEVVNKLREMSPLYERFKKEGKYR